MKTIRTSTRQGKRFETPAPPDAHPGWRLVGVLPVRYEVLSLAQTQLTDALFYWEREGDVPVP